VNGLSHYPANPPGTSKHEKGLALDILTTNLSWLVNALAQVGIQWAGPEDAIHFEIASGSRQTQKVAPVKVKAAPKKKSAAKKILGAASWVPGPVGWGASILDFLF
jgi:hypothetical protein